jgi:hypothetical protein
LNSWIVLAVFTVPAFYTMKLTKVPLKIADCQFIVRRYYVLDYNCLNLLVEFVRYNVYSLFIQPHISTRVANVDGVSIQPMRLLQLKFVVGYPPPPDCDV